MWFFKKRKKKVHLEKDQSSTFCMLPWTHLHALPNGNVVPCCVAPYKDAFDNLKNGSLKRAWNSRRIKELRLNMINNLRSESCSRCYEIESYGGTSLRNQMNDVFSDDYGVVSKTKKDGSLEEFKMLYLDIRFSNLCNLKCMGCSPALSSKWEDDYNKLYNKEKEHVNVLKISNLSDLFIDELVSRLGDVKRAYFAGGEPLLMEEHYKCLDYFLSNNQENIQLTYNTNLMVLKSREYDVLNYWQKFKNIHLSISIDDINEQGEYFRFGTNWNKLTHNIETVMKDCPRVTIEVTCTVNIFNIGRLPEIHDYLYSRNYIEENGFFLNYLLDPKHLRTQNLPPVVKNQVITKLLLYIESLKKKYTEKDWANMEESFYKQIDFLNGESNSDDIEKFKKWITKLDSIRGSSIHSSYPDIALAMGMNK